MRSIKTLVIFLASCSLISRAQVNIIRPPSGMLTIQGTTSATNAEHVVSGVNNSGGTLTFNLSGPKRQTNSESGALTIALANLPGEGKDRWIVAQFSPSTNLNLTWPTTAGGYPVRWVPDTSATVVSVPGGGVREVAIGWVGNQVFLADMYLTLDGDLADIKELTGVGLLKRVATDDWDLTSLIGTANEIVVTNGDGVGGDPTFSIPAAINLTGKSLTNGTFVTPSIANFINAQHTHANASSGGTLTETALALTDVTTGNTSATQHGFAPKLSGSASEFLNGAGTFTQPAGASFDINVTNSTTSATATPIFTNSVSTSTTVKLWAWVSGGGATNSAGYERHATFRRGTGAASLVATNSVATEESTASMEAGFVLSGNAALLMVQGPSSEPINWAAKGFYLVTVNAAAADFNLLDNAGQPLLLNDGTNLEINH